MDVSDFDFFLPPGAIAQRPAPRGTARLMTLARQSGTVAHRTVADLPELLLPGDLLVANDTKVIPARIFGTDEKGRRTEFLLVERIEERPSKGEKDEGEIWRCLAKPGRRVKAGRRFFFEGGWEAETIRSEVGLYLLRFSVHGSKKTLLGALQLMGTAPLPPYIHRPDGQADARDAADYQTIYAEKPGAIAAPTAGLHFTPELLAAVARRGVETARVTLHVGLGTFKPVKTERVEEHSMEPERGEIPEATASAVGRAKHEGRRVVAVGTTTVRTLEGSAGRHGAVVGGPFETNLFLVPGAPFRVVDALLTNFHLPRSTLLMLVSAFAGREHVLAAYRTAVTEGYRFFSYGDAMFIA